MVASSLDKKKVDYAALRELFAPHIESFDYFVEAGLETALLAIKPLEINDPSGSRKKLRIWFGKPEFHKPVREERGQGHRPVFPRECREACRSYKGRLDVDLCFQYDDGAVIRSKFSFGLIPIMLMSKLCHLRGAGPKELVEKKEEAIEMGGYFICSGYERLCRFLIVQKRNYPMAFVRKQYASHGEGCTDKAISIRCVREDQSSVSLNLYYTQNGSARIGFWVGLREYLIPIGIVLKALVNATDHEIYISLTSCYKDMNKKDKGVIGTQLVGERAKIILDETRDLSLFTRSQCLRHIGRSFQPIMNDFYAEEFAVVGEAVLRNYVLVHLQSNLDKFNLLVFMLQKLFALVDQIIAPDNSDALQNQEVLSPGHLIMRYLKEKLEMWLLKSRRLILETAKDPNKLDFSKLDDVVKVIGKSNAAVGKAIEGMIKTGKVAATPSLELPQREGVTIQADRLNYLRFISHFRSVHRGAVFAKMRTTAVRKLLPESWGFLCPVHTPDGTPCGLLNHMTEACRFNHGLLYDWGGMTFFMLVLFATFGFSSSLDPELKSLDYLEDFEMRFLSVGLIWYLDQSRRMVLADAIGISSEFDMNGNIRDYFEIQRTTMNALTEMGMVSLSRKLEVAAPPQVFHVLLDGRVIGSIASSRIEKVVAHLRKLKLLATFGIPNDLEVGYVPMSFGGAFPGLYLFTSPSRFIRPVRNIAHSSEDGPDIELIGPFEQVFMEIRCPDGGNGGRKDLFPATHEEIHPTSMLSVIAKLTPWSDHNQSPRNMYQCQMAKQTMGFYSQAVQFRADNKAYHLQTPQSPIVRTSTYNKYCMDEFPSGTNAIVAVLAYTGYDMEDAMILNKSSVERGLCRGHIYQTEHIDLEALHTKSEKVIEIFSRSNITRTKTIDADGLPYIGQMIKPKEPLYGTYNTFTSQTKCTELKGSEPAFVDYVALDGSSGKVYKQKANIRLRRPRNPIIGDKFSSRHGQKGVCSKLWPDIDMPFSAVTGMRPDLIINPHAFPSRMTIAMLLESIAAKGGSLEGKFVDATPFASATKTEESEAESFAPIDDLGPLLVSKGFNYHGTEVMYSGVFGTELVFEIFIGPVYYQRLRHMVSDKFQVRSTGAVDKITRQPVGGRKRGGGVRFGEMERDALLAHGTAYLLHDRLHTCSDYHIADVCSLCGSLLTAISMPRQKRAIREISGLPPGKPSKAFMCQACKTSKGMETVAMPYVFKYLAAELAAMNVKLVLNLSKESQT